MRRLISRMRVFWRGLANPARLDTDMNDEMRFHLDMEAQRIMRVTGAGAAEARRQAALAFGGVEKYRGAARDVLGLTRVRGLSLDLRLGIRMLRRSPGLTLVAVFALALAIGSGAAYLEFVNDLLHGRLPFPDAGRIVGIQNWDQQTGHPESRSTADFVAWRGSLRSFDSLGAYRALDRNLITPDGRAEPVRGVEVSAAAFHIAQLPPLLGRTLIADDERAGAPPVVVIGYNVWLTRFAGSPGVIGQVVRLGNTASTVVGVMPAGFGFPVSHSLWVPLRLNDASYAHRAGAPIKMFGRLAAGVTLAAAQAELNAVAAQTALEFPDVRYIRPVVKPYVESLWSAVDDAAIQMTVLYGANVLFLGLLGVCAANIATLVFARTATREAEISVRTALGASRARIAGQLFAEALVLSSIAAIAGLLFASYGLQWVKHTITVAQGMRLMFWWNDQLSPMTIAYAAVLTVVAALIVGVIPALKATGPHVQERLKHAAGGSNSGLRLGRLWTGVIVAQVALTVVFLATAVTLTWGSSLGNAGDRELTIPAAQFITASVTLDRDAAEGNAETPEASQAFRATLRARFEALERRLAAEPGVMAVTYAARLPGMNPLEWGIEVDASQAPQGATRGTFVGTTTVGASFFEALQARIVAGRGLTTADLAPGRPVAIVDQTFVRHVLGGRDAIGRQIRESAHDGAPPGPWIEIVGVVADLTADRNKGTGDAVVYRPALPDAVSPVNLAVRVAGDPAAMMSRLRVIAADVDPALRLDDLTTMDRISANDRVAIEFFARLLSGASVVALILATAGVYALMSFTVARRTAEIGIRLALGASTRRIVWATFSRAIIQVGAGVLAGIFPASVIVLNLTPEVSVADAPQVALTVCLVVALFMVSVSVLACVSPARRALHIQPTDALKST